MTTTSDPYEQTSDCPYGHSWVGGMVRVHPDDLYAWKPSDRAVECESCETRFIPTSKGK